MKHIFNMSNVITCVILAMVFAAVFTYTEPNYWVNVVGIAGTTFMLQMLAMGIYNLWNYFTKP